jgi:methionyl-tRNA synthetase
MTFGFASQSGEKFVVTSALPYVNGVKHLGNIIGSLLPADIFHRFLDLFDIENIYICGTDDHGTAVEISAATEGMNVADYAAKYYEIQRDIYKKWNFDFANFSKTSSSVHHAMTQAFFTAIHKGGFTTEQELNLPYCNSCKRFLPDRYIIGTCFKCEYENARGDQCEKCSTLLDPKDLLEPKCTLCNKKDIVFKKEKHLFLNLKKLQPQLEEWINKNDYWPTNVKTLALGWLHDGLKPRCITRNLKWGVPVPLKGHEKLVFYVWFDAPIGYISMTKEKFDDWRDWWSGRIYHFLGKDNIPFHTVFWPGILLAARRSLIVDKERFEPALPYYVAGYEYLNWEGEKFSTSRGIGLFSDEALELFPVDYWRYYLSRVLPENKDSNFDWEDFKNKINNELIANYGNLFYRVTAFIEKNFNGVPAPADTGAEEKELEMHFNESLNKIEKCVEDVRLKEALTEIMSAASIVNKYFQDKQPWLLEKQGKNSATCIYYAVNYVACLSALLKSYIPSAADDALRCLGASDIKWKDLRKFNVKPGQKIKSKILFKKIEEIPTKKEMLNIVTATIMNAKDHPNAEKLYILDIDLGFEKRQLVAGLRNIYKIDELIGKQILVLTNLKKAKLRGVESQGMLLACEDGTLIAPERKTDNGVVVCSAKSEITIDDFANQEMHIGKDNTVVLNGKTLKAGDVFIRPERTQKEGVKIS